MVLLLVLGDAASLGLEEEGNLKFSPGKGENDNDFPENYSAPLSS